MLFSFLILSFYACKEITVDFSSERQFYQFKRDCHRHCLSHSLRVMDHTHLFVFNASRGKNFSLVMRDLQRLKEQGLVQWYEEHQHRKREKRLLEEIVSPWHLGQMDLSSVWQEGIVGSGVRIAIVDDGIQTTHPDLATNIRPESSWNFNANRADSNPVYLKGHGGDWHGTASAGASAGGGDCSQGVAPKAELSALAILQNNANVGDAVEAMALSYKPQQNHIYSSSWGPMRPGSPGHGNEAPGPLVKRALEKTVKEGRGGLGSVYVWAAGNDGRSGDSCAYDGYASMRYAMLIGASDSQGNVTPYSETCAGMLALAPGGLGKDKIFTSDLVGKDGLTAGNCTYFSGTSAATPLAAGVVTLILQVNPRLSWLDVQYVLIESCKPNQRYGHWVKNSAGYWHSNSFGFGLLNARRAVSVAKQWNQSIDEIHAQSWSNKTIITQEKNMSLHHVIVVLWTNHANVSETTIYLHSPVGTKSLLAWPHRDFLSRWQGWEFLSRTFHGERSAGEWRLEIIPPGLEKWQLKLYGR
jgi:furin